MISTVPAPSAVPPRASAPARIAWAVYALVAGAMVAMGWVGVRGFVRRVLT